MEEYMRKKKHKKKNKNMKKREIQKMQVENQQEVLGADVDKNQVENKQEILVDAAEKEQRRTTRLGAIIAIVAVIGTLCAFLFKMTISPLNVWSEQGVMYWYLQALFSFALATSVPLGKVKVYVWWSWLKASRVSTPLTPFTVTALNSGDIKH